MTNLIDPDNQFDYQTHEEKIKDKIKDLLIEHGFSKIEVKDNHKYIFEDEETNKMYTKRFYRLKDAEDFVKGMKGPALL